VAVQPRENDYEICSVEGIRLYSEKNFGGMHITSARTVRLSAALFEARSRHSSLFAGREPDKASV